MQTIQLVGDKSVMQFDLETVPITDFVQFQGRLYKSNHETHLVWEPVDDKDTLAGTLVVLDGAETMLPTVIVPAEPPLEPAPIDPSPTPTEPPVDAQPDHAETV